MTIRLLQRLIFGLFVLTLAAFVGTQFYTRTQLDRTPPVITCDSEVVEVRMGCSDEDLLAGVTATDNRDGDITASLIIKGVSQLITADTAKITYLAIDSSNNMSTASRTVHYTDYEKPRFSLTQPLMFQAGGSVRVLNRLKASDTVDGDLTGAIRVTSQNVDTAMAGVYTITVQVTNSLGDMEILSLPLVLTAGPAAASVKLSDYILYLEQGQRFVPTHYITAPADRTAVKVEHDVDVNTPGAYTVSYTCEDATVYQTVVVR